MNDAKLRQRPRGDERLLLTCLAVERLCAQHVPASVRLEAKIGRVTIQRLVVPLAQRLITRDHSVQPHQRVVAAA